MSLANGSPTYRGRYTKPVATSNLMDDVSDFPAFESFDNTVTPRGVAPTQGSLSVVNVDMCQATNEPVHYTSAYDILNLVVRRCTEFVMVVTFSRPLTEEDDIQVEFLIGTDPMVNQGSQVVVTFGNRQGSGWAGRIMSQDGPVVTLGITPSANALVGKFRTYVCVVAPDGMFRTERNPDTDLYLLFNVWCADDCVFIPNEAERVEYVLNDSGVIFQGSVGSVSPRNWVYGQFEKGVLDACIHILDASQIPISDRGDAIKVVRKGSAIINSQDDNGVCVGNWGEDFSMGTSPTSWSGSTKILLEYANTGVPVCYAQCWVFAGVFNTFLRAIGIGSRVITNFSSAHDNTGNLKTDLIFLPDGSPDERHTRDSIWNYHCWNESWLCRPDLPAGLGGWQVVDATPQETSDGHFRCGPASVAAIKQGLICHQYDCAFVLAEVNSDVICHKRDKYGTLTPFNVDTTLVGQFICTKAVGSNGVADVTHTYKHPEGSAADTAAMAQAEGFGSSRDSSKIPESQVSVTILLPQKVNLGQDVDVLVEFLNRSDIPRTIQGQLDGYIIYYTGVTSSHFKHSKFSITIPPKEVKTDLVTVKAEEYAPLLGSQASLRFIVTGLYDQQALNAMRVLNLEVPPLIIEVSGLFQVQQQMYVRVSFTNPYGYALQNVHVCMEGPGIINHRHRYYSIIEPHGSISWQESCSPRLGGHRGVVAVMDCDQIRQMQGVVYINVQP